MVEPVCTDYPIATELHNVPPPPDRGVAAVESWAAGLNLRAAVGLETATAEEAPRLAAVVGIVRELGKLKDKSARAEKALTLRRLRLGGDEILVLLDGITVTQTVPEPGMLGLAGLSLAGVFFARRRKAAAAA